jgi:hypothetical protein
MREIPGLKGLRDRLSSNNRLRRRSEQKLFDGLEREFAGDPYFNKHILKKAQRSKLIEPFSKKRRKEPGLNSIPVVVPQESAQTDPGSDYELTREPIPASTANGNRMRRASSKIREEWRSIDTINRWFMSGATVASLIGLGAVAYIGYAGLTNGSHPADSNLPPGISSLNTGHQPSSDQNQITESELQMPNDSVAGIIVRNGIDSNFESIHRLIVEPQYVQTAFDEFTGVLVGTPFERLLFSNEETVSETIKSLQLADASELSKHFAAAASDNELTFNFTSTNPVMETGTNINVKEYFTDTKGVMLKHVFMTARVVDVNGNIFGNVGETVDTKATANGFSLKAADNLITNLGFNPVLIAHSLPNTKVRYTDLKGNTLTLYANGVLEYDAIPGEANLDLHDMVATVSPIQEAAVVVEAAIASQSKNIREPVTVFDITKALTGKMPSTNNLNRVAQSLYTASEAA